MAPTPARPAPTLATRALAAPVKAAGLTPVPDGAHDEGATGAAVVPAGATDEPQSAHVPVETAATGVELQEVDVLV